MRYLLVWWIICPGHSQKIHMEKYQSYEACVYRAAEIDPRDGRPLHWHCSVE
jgi:hypothetical protein